MYVAAVAPSANTWLPSERAGVGGLGGRGSPAICASTRVHSCSASSVSGGIAMPPLPKPAALGSGDSRGAPHRRGARAEAPRNRPPPFPVQLPPPSPPPRDPPPPPTPPHSRDPPPT